MKWESFLQAVLGDVGYQAVKATDPLLLPVIVPRSIIGWIETVSANGYEGSIPGVSDSYISLTKSEDGFEGAVTINDKLLTFERASSFHVAASLGTSLEIKLPELSDSLKKKDLSEFGKAIDLLIKTQIISLHKADAARQGPPAPPIKPKKQTIPVGASRMPNQVVPPNMAVGQGQAQKLKITKTEAEKVCQMCAKKRFKDKEFQGCDCLEEISKHVKTELTPDGYSILFDRVLSEEALEALVTLLKD